MLALNQPFAAKTDGECDICWLPIQAGETIVIVEMDGDTGYAHEKCATGEHG